MISFINRILRRKSSGSISSSPQEKITEEIHIDSNKNIDLSTSSPAEKQNRYPLEIPHIVAGTAQSVGIQRDHNEDALFSLTSNLMVGGKTVDFGLYIIADGMGGHINGEVASTTAVEKLSAEIVSKLYIPLFSLPEKKQELSIQEIIHNAVLDAHQEIKNKAPGGGTTLTAVLILGDQMTIAHVGDSRAYMLNPDGILQLLTHDHSLVKRLEEIGQISPEEALSHPQRNYLYRALGQGEPFEPDIYTHQLQSNSQIIICTDGLWGAISEDAISKAVSSTHTPLEGCQLLVNLANDAGGADNISVIIVDISEQT